MSLGPRKCNRNRVAVKKTKCVRASGVRPCPADPRRQQAAAQLSAPQAGLLCCPARALSSLCAEGVARLQRTRPAASHLAPPRSLEPDSPPCPSSPQSSFASTSDHLSCLWYLPLLCRALLTGVIIQVWFPQQRAVQRWPGPSRRAGWRWPWGPLSPRASSLVTPSPESPGGRPASWLPGSVLPALQRPQLLPA